MHSEMSNDKSQRQSSKTQRVPSQDRDSLKKPEARQKQSSSEQRASTPTNQPADIYTSDDLAINMEARENLFPEGMILSSMHPLNTVWHIYALEYNI